MDNFSSKFEGSRVFRFRVNGGHGTGRRTDRQRDGLDVSCNAARGWPHNKRPSALLIVEKRGGQQKSRKRSYWQVSKKIIINSKC